MSNKNNKKELEKIRKENNSKKNINNTTINKFI